MRNGKHIALNSVPLLLMGLNHLVDYSVAERSFPLLHWIEML
jgi:hypothetical protein